MFFYFRKLLSYYTSNRLASKAVNFTGGALLTGYSLYVANKIPDLEEKEIVLNNFLDQEGCNRALTQHRVKKLRE